MEYGYYLQATMTATGEYIPMYYPQPTVTSQYIPMYYSPQTTAIDEAATIKQLERQFLRETQRQQSTSPRSKLPRSPKRKASNPNLGMSLCENHLAIGMIVFVPSKMAGQKNCSCVLPDCQRRSLDDGGYSHPAVVLDIQDNRAKGGELTALCCIISANPQPNREEKPSSFTITKVQKENGESPDAAPNGATVLYLEPAGTMHKKCHIGDSHVYAIPISQLTNFGTPLQNRLTQESYKDLASIFPSITPRKWIKTAKLVAGEKDPEVSSSLLTTIPATIPAKVQEPVQATPPPAPVAIPVKLQETIDSLLQYLTKEQLFEAVPEMIAEYPQLIKLLA
ncbi:hypothetical protein N431DRAFT_466057 [Stipitochalara longipes BDJ]|nr:hypothetical protein N431DRAFT_466057 [Stipitochalara longipes BDJ]